MAKKKKCPEFENHERWLVAFADMMTLLFALFVVLYAIAVVNTSKVKQVSESFQAAFGIREQTTRDDTVNRGPILNDSIFEYIKGNTSREQILQRLVKERAAIIAAEAKVIEQKIAERLYGSKQFPTSEKPPQERVVYVARDPDGIRITLMARGFFKPSSVEMEDSAKPLLEAVGLALKDIHRTIRVEGHTDNLPFHKDNMTNWELSALRATEVAKVLIENGSVGKNQIYAAGFADTRPLAVNDTPEDRAMNRRVDIKILYDQPGDYIPPDDSLGLEKSHTDG